MTLNLNPVSVSFPLGDGREVTIETGKLARQADGAVTVRLGNCIVFASVVAAREPKPGQSFFPLTVDYQEKFAAAGRIPGSFFKREARLNDYEILTSRLIDRALRPLFPDNYFCEVQVIVNLISSDPEVMPDALACLAASAALAVSDVPIQEIISETRVARINGEFKINPGRTELATADMDFIIAATDKNIMMVEGEAKECQEADVITAIETAHAAIRVQVKAQEELRMKVGSPAKREYPVPTENEELKTRIQAMAASGIADIARAGSAKHDRTNAFKAAWDKLKEQLGWETLEADGGMSDADKAMAKRYYEDLQYYTVRNMILDESRRLDGRKLDEVRPLAMEIDYLPGPHGSALFTRGETQSLTTVTMGTSQDELLLETAASSEYSNFYLHYNFPPYSTGEAKMMRGPGRREVGHGALARRSLAQMMPGKDYPYTIRIVSEILESNGSSSMATVCAGSLALMDAGVPFPKHVGGVAMGLISRTEDKKWAVLTDILGDEDHLGDMDFKVTGTRDGICGIQMDIKVDGLGMDVMRSALAQARDGRLHIIDAMYQCTAEARTELKPHTPRVEQIVIDAEFIGAIIGPGGKIIQEIQRETGTTISVDEADQKGYVKVFSQNKEGIDAAMKWLKGIVAQPEVGEEYEGTVKDIKPFGAFVEFMPGKQGLLHISEVSWSRLESLDGVMNIGDKVQIKLIGTDPKTGKLRLSHKVLLPKPEGYTEPERRERSDRGDRPERGERRERGSDRGERRDRDGDRGDRRNSSDRGDRGPRSDRGPRGDRPERGERSERSDRNDRGDRNDRQDSRNDRSDRIDRNENRDNNRSENRDEMRNENRNENRDNREENRSQREDSRNDMQSQQRDENRPQQSEDRRENQSSNFGNEQQPGSNGGSNYSDTQAPQYDANDDKDMLL